MPSLNWKHHTLIQALITRGPLKEKDFHAVFSGVTGKSPGAHQALFNEYLLRINRELSSCQFELRGCRDQYDGQICYGVVNNVADAQSKLGTKYSAPQIAFYKGIIEAIAQDVTAQGSISNTDALNIQLENQVLATMESQSRDGPLHIPAAFRNFTMSQKEKTLNELVQDKWLCRMSDGKMGLGVRSCLDLRGWFRNLDVPYCEVCNEAVVKGELCRKEGCAVRIHHYCLKKFSQRKGETLCPGCGLQWQIQVPKAEVIEEGEEPSEPVPSQPPPGPKRKRLRTNEAHDTDILRCSSSQSSLPSSDFRRTTRSSTRSASQSSKILCKILVLKLIPLKKRKKGSYCSLWIRSVHMHMVHTKVHLFICLFVYYYYYFDGLCLFLRLF
ncbi:non-structural maintenance of chromosomes element 1-like, partial [Melia azedarach]